MTCIIGFADGETVWIGGDTAGSDGRLVTQRSDPKVFQNGEFLMGFTTSFRMGQLLRYKLKIPVQDQEDDFTFMVTTFVDAVRDCLKAGGVASKDKEVEEGGCFLVGYRGNIYTIYGDYQVEGLVDDYMAVGSGAHYALGAVFSSYGNPEERILTGLQAASYFCGSVRPPFTVMTSKEVNYRIWTPEKLSPLPHGPLQRIESLKSTKIPRLSVSSNAWTSPLVS